MFAVALLNPRDLCFPVFALLDGGEQVSELRTGIAAHLSGEAAPAQEIRNRAARGILERAANLYRHERWLSQIDMASRFDHLRLRPLLEEIAGLLSPGTARRL